MAQRLGEPRGAVEVWGGGQVVAVRKLSAQLFRCGLDLSRGVFLFLLGVLLTPLACGRGSAALQHGWRGWRVLLARGLFTRFVRAGIEWRLGNCGVAIAHLEGVAAALESACRVRPQPRHIATVLQEVYVLQARLYLYSGHIEGALLLIVRACKVLGINRLPALPELDARTAHLVRASIAAGKLLDHECGATLVVKVAVLEPRAGRARPSHPRGRAAARGKAKIIPFPSCNSKRKEH